MPGESVGVTVKLDGPLKRKIDELESRIEDQIKFAHNEIDMWWPSIPRDMPLYMRVRYIHSREKKMQVCTAEEHRYSQVTFNPVVTGGGCPLCKLLANLAHAVEHEEMDCDGAGLWHSTVPYEVEKLLEEQR